MGSGSGSAPASDELFISPPLTLRREPAPWFPPPPTAPIREKKTAGPRPIPGVGMAVKSLKLAIPPPAATPSPRVSEDQNIDEKTPILRKAVPLRGKSIRKTLLQRVDGWWDLGLLDKRQTMMMQAKRQAQRDRQH